MKAQIPPHPTSEIEHKDNYEVIILSQPENFELSNYAYSRQIVAELENYGSSQWII